MSTRRMNKEAFSTYADDQKQSVNQMIIDFLFTDVSKQHIPELANLTQ